MAQLQLKGKSFVQNHHLVVPSHELIPRPEKSLMNKVRLDDSLIIHGDNLLALRALLPMRGWMRGDASLARAGATWCICSTCPAWRS